MTSVIRATIRSLLFKDMVTHSIYKFSWKNVTSICIKLRRGPIFMIRRARKLTWINTRPDQSMAIYHRKSNRSIDNNRWQLVNCYRLLSANRWSWPIDNHKLESSNCYRLPSITIDYHRSLITIDCHLLSSFCFRSIFDQLLSYARGRVRVWWLLLRLLHK